MYDESSNQFVHVDEVDVPARKREGRIVFAIGETVTLKGLDFLVFNVTDRNIILRPLKKQAVAA